MSVGFYARACFSFGPTLMVRAERPSTAVTTLILKGTRVVHAKGNYDFLDTASFSTLGISSFTLLSRKSSSLELQLSLWQNKEANWFSKYGSIWREKSGPDGFGLWRQPLGPGSGRRRRRSPAPPLLRPWPSPLAGLRIRRGRRRRDQRKRRNSGRRKSRSGYNPVAQHHLLSLRQIFQISK